MLYDVSANVTMTRLAGFGDYLPVSFLVDLLSEVILVSRLSILVSDFWFQGVEIGKDRLL